MKTFALLSSLRHTVQIYRSLPLPAIHHVLFTLGLYRCRTLGTEIDISPFLDHGSISGRSRVDLKIDVGEHESSSIDV